MPANATPLTPARRLIALEDARDWLNAATAAVRNGNTPMAVFSVHAAIRHATEAQETLIDSLVPRDDEVTS